MDFVDVSQFKIVSMRRFSTLRIVFDGDEYLGMTLEDAAQSVANLLRVTYKSPSVFYNITVNNAADFTLDDFELVCENLISAIFRRNALVDVRDEVDKERILNVLPRNR